MNERKTEEIIRNKLRELGYYADSTIIIEEQNSDNPRIKKLLKSASKSGGGAGYPDFIISSKKHSDFLIVIECKPDIRKHESVSKDKYKDYAVDGALLYASYLSKEYDVLAIGVSGEKEEEIKISHYLWLRNDNAPHKILDSEILKYEDYFNAYQYSDLKFNQDLSELLDFASELNKTLHIKKIPEAQRSLVVSGILIALNNRAFRGSYKKYETAKEIMEDLVKTIIRELKKSKIPSDKIENLETAFSFMKTHTTLTTDKEFVIKLIDDIDEKLNNFIKTYKYYDILGKFYVEFLRYANSDKKLGIILTPPHITELFCELAEITKDSIVLDNCCGTGGFLISAMKKMIEKASSNSKKIKEIKEKQIVGIEYQDHIYALAITNMIVHGDGKTNIYHGSCFDETIKKEVKEKFKPNVGLLNPPYKIEKDDTNEFKFVLNNLSMLEPGGKCVAILPMRCVLATDGEDYEFKKKLLKNHTLEAVMSMPDDLFYPVGVVTAVIVITAHKPHPDNKKVWFGYFKDDGFIKIKHKGRVDYYNRWPQIKETWVSAYINKEAKAGLSVLKSIKAEEPWCAELYMETDYSQLTHDDFRESILKYIAFEISEGNIDVLDIFMIDDEENKKELPLEVEKWEYFRLDELFDIKKGKRVTKKDMDDGSTPFISASKFNNGLTAKINHPPIFKGNTITVNYDGSVGMAFYQPRDYFALDSVNVLEPRFDMDVYIAMFLITIIKKERYRFNYGLKWTKERMEKSKIKLPVTKDGNPN
ncbi:N-6 DNA Methylase family [Aciduliprofundum boonei T469]|nr:N-6 DNA Methylase family [Aciduliprofundum boonei T469]